MTKQQRPAAQGGFGVFTGMSLDDWMAGMGIAGDDPGDGLADGGSVYTEDELDIINNPDRAMPGMVSRGQHLALRAALAGQDFHDAYHVHGMKDAVNCLLCFDYDERHGQDDPTTGDDLDGPGCRDCGTPPDSTGGNYAHLLDCPAVAR